MKAENPARAPKGTHDVMWPESWRWQRLVATFASVAEGAGFGLVINPMFEEVRVFHRGIGEHSEVVGKEMYEFEDRGGRRLALRPEGTASVVRSYVEHRPSVPWKAWYVTPAFRYERAQAGRYRQHHQLGVEALGTDDPGLDVEVIALAADFFSEIGLMGSRLAINSMGCRQCRSAYREVLLAYLKDHEAELCDEHGAFVDANQAGGPGGPGRRSGPLRRYEINPLRVLDCKTTQCRSVTAGAPTLVDFLDEECASHFSRVRSGLDKSGISYELDSRLVRGFDYYTRTTFEVSSCSLETAQNAIGGGGRYDGLVEQLGGPPTPGIGFGIGIERVLLACDAEGVFASTPPAPDAFVIDLTGGDVALEIVIMLRRAGLRVDRAYGGRSMKAQMKAADRSGARFAVIVGEEEAARGEVTLRSMNTGDQRRIGRSELAEALR